MERTQQLNEQHQYLICRIRTRLCALDLSHVIETLRPLPVEPFGKQIPCVRGLAIVRGAPIPVVDAGEFMGLTDDAHPKRWVTVRTGGRCIALEVEEVAGIRRLEGALLSDLPTLLEGEWGERIAAVGAFDAELLVVLGAIRVIPEDMWESLAERGSPA